MKYTFLISAVAIMMASCNNNATTATEATDAQAVATDSMGISYKVDATASTLAWTGYSVANYTHHGTINLKEGQLTAKDGKLTAGSFTIDMNSIKALDGDEKKNADLAAHLNSPDFFDVANNAESKFEITAVEPLAGDTAGNTHTISGNLTMRGQSKNISFPAKVTITDTEVAASGTVTVNRTDWGVNFHSVKAEGKAVDFAKWKDKAINDNFTVAITLKATK